jgi:hypothetical protein
MASNLSRRSSSSSSKSSSSSSSRLLSYVLDQPALVHAVRALDGGSLGKLIQHVGLEDAGELIALVSHEQLEQVLDQDLWRAASLSGDEHFDPKRFATWLAVMLNVGEDFTVRRLCALPRDLLTLAVHRLVFVIDMDALMSDPPDEATEKALDSALHEEWEEFGLIARDSDGWDSLWQVLVALDQEHHELLRSLLERCAGLDAEIVEDHGGLFEALRTTDVLDDDVAEERMVRRAALGYVTPADARSFLALAAKPAPSRERDPMTKAYFRGLQREEHSTADVSALIALLQQLGVQEERTRVAKLPAGAGDATGSMRALFEAAMEELRDTHVAVFDERREELSYLTNVLLAGTSERELRPIEALDLVLDHCSRGLQREVESRPSLAAAKRVLLRVPADVLFRIGYAPGPT